MQGNIEKRKPAGPLDYVALGVTTFGVGYIPGAPGTYGSLAAVGIYLGVGHVQSQCALHGLPFAASLHYALNAVLLTTFVLVGIWAAGRTTSIFGDGDPSQAVVDEVAGQLITFCFVPFGLGWPFILAGFLLFRLFDIWKPFPIDQLQEFRGGLGVVADDIVAGVYAGICLAISYAAWLLI
ncbi:MAG: phosphatidylglycerophosphatase A [Chloracidobacterium sp.]|nr:phosphatidylglycerophosphatase A [Chloracidobacterium sp.]